MTLIPPDRRAFRECIADPAETLQRASETPKVSIGLPVWNGSATIDRAIRAIQAQSFRDFELIISDNASTDNTLEICESAALSDSRIRVIRQGRNHGPVANFGFVLRKARGQFFMFAAADDWVEPNFIEEALSILDETPDAVACTPRTLIHFNDSRGRREARGSGPIRGPSWWRLARFLVWPADNSRFYGLYRIEVLRAAYLHDVEFHALDWAISALTLAQGAHVRSRSVILNRTGARRGKYNRELSGSTLKPLDRFFPVGRMSVALCVRLSTWQLLLVAPTLVLLNLQKSVEYLWHSALRK